MFDSFGSKAWASIVARFLALIIVFLFFAIFVEDDRANMAHTLARMKEPPYHLPLPEKVAQKTALPLAMRQFSEYSRLAHAGLITPCRTIAALKHALFASDTLACVLHMEGVEAIDRDFHVLEVFYQAGLRSLSLTWSRNNDFA